MYLAIVLSAMTSLLFIYGCLLEGDGVKSEARKIPILLHGIKKTKNDVNLYKLESIFKILNFIKNCYN